MSSLAPGKKDAINAVYGFAMGSANVVPGVSGGTIALIVGIYPRLVNAIASFDAQFLRLVKTWKIKEASDHIDFRFLAGLGVGNVLAIVSLAKILSWLIINKPIPIWSLFFGLILASAVLVFKEVKKWSAGAAAAALAGALFTYWISGMMPAEASHSHTVLFFSGAIAIAAMILPGISGSFVLVLLGQYLFILQAIHERRLAVIASVGLGCAAGLIAFTKFLRYLLSHFHNQTMACLCGLMAGSLRKIWPFKVDAAGQEMLKAKHRVQINFLPDTLDDAVLWAIGMVIVGAVAVFLLERFGGKETSA